MFALFLFLAEIVSFAQDSRTVTEPVFPGACAVLTAQLPNVNGDLPASAENSFDTARIQSAINSCAPGQAVELAADTSGNNSFLIQPITLAAGVTLLVDPGVTVFASRNPRDFDVQAGSCGIVATTSKGCQPVITVSNAPNSAIMGFGIINGRGGDTLLGPGVPANTSWWDLASQAQQQNLSQFVPILVAINGSSNFILYKITLINSPMFHVTYHGGPGISGFTAWGVKITTPFSSRNTDGIDPSNATDVTITNSYISDGDDNVAVGASQNLSSNISVINDHFYSGHGMSIGSFTAGGVSNMVVDNVQFAGNASDPNAIGIRIKSANDRGGTISNVRYSHICIQNIRAPLVFNPFYNSNPGTLIPNFQSITLSNVHVLTEGRVQLDGASISLPLGLTLDNVVFDSLKSTDLNPALQDANITLGPGPVSNNLVNNLSGTGINVINNITSPSEAPYDCSQAFVYLAGELTGSTATVNQGQLVNLIAIVQPVVAGAPLPTGTVQILENGSVAGMATLPGASDLIRISLPNVVIGPHTYSALYSGDSNYAPLAFGSFSVAVTPNSLIPTQTQISGVPQSASFGVAIPATATVSSSGSGSPTGTVTFLQGNNQLASVPLSSGQASTTLTGLPAGSYQISAAYNGDQTFAGSTAAPVSLMILPAATTTSLISSSTQVNAGTTIALTTSVGSSAGIPTGNVNFMDSAQQIGTAPLVNGSATVNAALGVGSHSLTAVYAGSQNYAGSISASVQVTVTPSSGAGASVLPNPFPYLINTVAGGAASNCSGSTSAIGDGCPATQVVLSSDLRAVATDSFGNLFIADTNNNRIRKVNAASGIISTFAGGATACAAKTDSYGDGCPAAQTGNFNHPRGLWVDAAGNVFIAGYQANVVHKVQASNGIMVLVAGLLSTSGTGTSGAGADNVPATASALNAPRGVWTDSNGNIYIADTGNNKIRVVYVGGVIPNVATPVVGSIYTVAGNGTSGSTGDGGPANAAGVELKTPQGGVTDNNGNVFISDGGGRVRVVYMGGALVAQLIAIENPGTTAQVGNIYTIAGGSSKAYTAPAIATSVAVGGPQKLFLDAGNNLYIADSNANSVWFLDVRTGFIRRIVGGATAVCSTAVNALGDDCPGTQATINSGGNGLGVTLDNSGNLYVTDTTDLRVRKVSPNLQFGPAGVGSTATQTVWMHYVAGDSPATTNAFGLPSSFSDFSLAGVPNCTLNPDTTTDCLLQLQFTPVAPGRRSAPLTASSTAGAVAHFGIKGQGLGAGGAIDPAQLINIGQNLSPQGVAVDSGLNVYVADGNSKQVIKYAPGSATGTPVLTGLSEPRGVAVDAAGNIYVADAGSGKVLQATVDGTVRSVGSGLITPSGVAVDGNGNIYIADAGQTKLITISSDLLLQRTFSSGFSSPAAVAVDEGFNVYVADAGASTVTRITPAGSSTLLNTGAITPTGVAVDVAGNLYVSDAGAQNVTEVPFAPGSTAHAVVANLTTPGGVAIDGVGNIYVADSSATKMIQLQRTQGVLNFPDSTTILTAVLSNIGNQPVTPTGFTQTDTKDFNLSTSGNNGCNFSTNIAQGSACTLTAQFTPQANGALADVVTLTGNYANLAAAPFHTLNLTLFGNGSIVFPTQLTIAPIAPASPVFGQPITISAMVTSSGGTPTGSLTFAIDGIALSPLPLDGNGAVSTAVSNIAAGVHTLTALYSGSIQFSGSTGTPLSFSVAQAGTSVTWTPPANNIVYGSTLAGTLNANSSVPGTFTYLAQSGSASPFSVNTTTVLPVGAYQLTVTFAPADSIDYLPSSAGIPLTVVQAGTTAGLGVTQSVVAADSSGNFATMNAGLQSLPSSGGSLYIKPGTYKEQEIITAPNVSLFGLGGDPTKVILTNNLSNGPNNLNGHLGDQGSATVQALGNDFYADTITFLNTFDFENNQDTTPNAQALAVWVTSDRAIFNNSRFIGRQDTIFGGSKGCSPTTCTSARQYFFGSYVEGNVDYIFGDGATVFESSMIHSVYHAKASNEATITAQNKRFIGAGNYLSGEVFSNCTLTAENDNGTMTNLYLGRPFGVFSTNVYLNTNMQAPINGAGWIEFTPGVTNNLPTSFYAEYNSTGPGALGPRESFAVQLTAATAAPWQPLTFLAGNDGWNPQTTLAQRAAAVVPAAQSLTVQQGSPFTLISRITPAVGGSPTGSVQFFDNSNLLATVNVDATLEAVFSSSSLPVGNHAITIQYSGDANFIGSTSSPVNITISPASTNLELALSSNTSSYGSALTATASLSSSGQGTPTGTVIFSVDGIALPGVPIMNNSATFLLPFAVLSAGSHSVSASYSGDANFATSNSSAVSLSVAQAATSTGLTSSATSVAFGSSVNFVAKVAPAIAGVPTGTAQFFDGPNSLATVTLDATGAANFTTSSLRVGLHSITIQYFGDTNFIASTSSPVSITITPASTSLTLTLSPTAPIYGNPITATASLTIPGQGTPGGTVTFTVDGNPLSPVPIVNSFATSVLPLTALSAGTHSVSAAYSGDPNFTASNSSTVSLNVAQATTATALTSSNVTSAFGTATTLTVKVTPATAGVPTGSAQFLDGPNSLATASLDATGASSFNTSSLSVGTHSITVQYSGDNNFTASSSSPVNITITPASTNLSLTLSSTTLSYGSPVTANATLTIPGQGTPTGTVTFSVDGKALPAAPISNNMATASLPLAVLTASSHNVSAAYSGDANFTTSSSNAVSLDVAKAATATVLTSSAATTVFGSSATFTATVTPPGAGLPTGTVQFFDGANSLATIAVDATGTASFATSVLSVGAHSITVQYSGDANFKTSVSSPASITITPGATNLALTLSPNTPSFGNPVTATASIGFSAPVAPSGTVIFSVDNATLPAVTVASSSTSLVLPTLGAGAHTVAASYSGDSSFAPSTAGPIALNISKAGASVTLVSSAPTAILGTSVTFAANVTPAAGNALTGSITFLDGATPISPAISLSSNTGSFSISTLALGGHIITAQYSGDANYLNAISTPLSITIFVRPDFSISLGRTVLHVDDDGRSSDVVTLTPIGAYSGTISFGCSGLPRHTACVFDPSSLILANGNSQTTLLKLRMTRGDEGDDSKSRDDVRNDRDGRQFQVTVTATDGVISHTAMLILVLKE